MKQQQFEAANAALWRDIAAIVDGSATDKRTLPTMYRRLCQCLARSQQRGYSPALTAYLQHMVGDCHRLIYGTALERPNTLLHWMLVEVPRRVRGEWKLLLLACIALVGVAIGVGLLVWFKPQWAYSFAAPGDLAKYRDMYQPSNINVGRGEEGDMLMFGHYVWNNVSICFRSFAGGIFGGIPALLSIAFNGMHMGLIASWLSQDPDTSRVAREVPLAGSGQVVIRQVIGSVTDSTGFNSGNSPPRKATAVFTPAGGFNNASALLHPAIAATGAAGMSVTFRIPKAMV